MDLTHKALTLGKAKSKIKKRGQAWETEGHDVWNMESGNGRKRLRLKELMKFKITSLHQIRSRSYLNGKNVTKIQERS